MTTARGLDAVKDATWHLHIRAERSGVIADILAGRATRAAAALLLRNLLPVYQILDASRFADAALARSAAIQADLGLLSPNSEPPLLPEGRAYADRVKHAAQGDGAELIAHAYVRYLGDLNGGEIIGRRLITCLGPVANGLAFHRYPLVLDKAAFIISYRGQLDRALQVAGSDRVAQEAITGFEMNIALSQAISARSASAS